MIKRIIVFLMIFSLTGCAALGAIGGMVGGMFGKKGGTHVSTKANIGDNSQKAQVGNELSIKNNSGTAVGGDKFDTSGAVTVNHGDNFWQELQQNLTLVLIVALAFAAMLTLMAWFRRAPQDKRLLNEKDSALKQEQENNQKLFYNLEKLLNNQIHNKINKDDESDK